MESKYKIIIIISLVGLLIVVLASLLIGYILELPDEEPSINQNLYLNTNKNTNVNFLGHFPFSQGNLIFGSENGDLDVTAKERKLFADYYQLNKIYFTPQVPQYQLPINVKADALNYRDLSRKIDLDPYNEQLDEQGLVIIDYPFTKNRETYSEAYQDIYEQKIPVFVTTDSIAFLNELQFNLIFKEIEQEIFYQTIWQVTEKLYNKAKFRFDKRRQDLTIASDPLTEAARLETAFFATALELLKPKPNQIRDEGISIGLEKKYFSKVEANFYNFEIPETIASQVNQEIALINQHRTTAKSPLFLYRKDYRDFAPDPAYQTSEKLKNYSLTANFYSQNIFPLYEASHDCPDCLLDKDDQRIALITASFIAQDFRDDKEARNLWLKIYKTISFFKGLENDLTYLHYLDSLISLYGYEFDAE